MTGVDAIPLHVLGVVDVDANDVLDNGLLVSTLQNITWSDWASGWAVKQSSDFANKYPCLDSDGNCFEGSTDNPNHLGCFLCLFPYSQGGFEVGRPVAVSYDHHAPWVLQYEGKQFRKDLYFMFQVFGISQKRKLCVSAALQISKRSFLQHEHTIHSLKTVDFEKAVEQERTHKRFTDSMMISLRQTLNTICTKVVGTDKSCIHIRSLI